MKHKQVTVCIGTYGDAEWYAKAVALAGPTELEQGCEVVIRHADTLAQARNDLAEAANGEWLIFLDADDSLEPGYVGALMSAHGDLRAPAVRYVYSDGSSTPPQTFGERDMLTMNQCVIGTAIRRSMFWDVGGFWEERAWEDWSLFRRMYLLGASITHNPEAIYRATVNYGGRNGTVYNPQDLNEEIRRSHEEWLVKYHRGDL
jgi:glycosyltransferase involved in cell wall biosynthesis